MTWRIDVKLVRFGVSVKEDLLKQFDFSINQKGYANRSEAIRDLIRLSLLKGEDNPSASAIGVIGYVFNHRKRELQHKLTHIGHRRLGEVISSMHIHIDETHCLEVVVAKGIVKELQELADEIISSRGVIYGELILSPHPKRL
ncbi:nickel-responsive transcriptional regulator NikR [candidate division WOR-3 bacterium]|uniref:Putative nickel-responsive regulator n=1 Tax=candidate division WOR-3 bacterium TaxID=2052148 RepID=A0A9D5K7B1_UNCW3|nr:nickel-responsive transcriptional regulator NikR [candidate division WOR-3 bacterium]MBD3363623.1 nickel-responsive transcriptional regulator NikR [candidate division WOR-3 bacterium]